MRLWLTLAATLVASGTARAQTGPDAPYEAVASGGAATTSGGTTIAIALIDVETRHAALGAGWDGAMGFQAGRRPLLTMTTSSSDGAVEPSDSGGFIIAESMRFGRAAGSIETALVGRIGATRADDNPAAVRNDISGWALLFDATVDLRWHGRDAARAHSTRPLTPIVSAWIGVRHDQRFHRAGDLGGFDDPTGRIVGGLTVNPIHRAAHGLTVGAGVEFESALRGPTRLPSGVRLAVTAGVHLRSHPPG